MFISKRAIPRLATTGLVLGGAACKSSDASPGSIAADLCFGFLECDPVAFDATWLSTGECRDYYGQAYADLADAAAYYEGGNCVDAALDYYGCYWDWYRATCDAYEAYDACTGAYNRFVDVCNL